MKRTLMQVRELPFTDDELLDLVSSGKDFEKIADAYDNNAFNKAVALCKGKEYADEHPVEPLTESKRSLLMAEKMQHHLGKCPEHWIHGQDDNGHSFAKEIYCGREWCPICGQKNSAAHLRRFARWLPKVQSVSSIGYFVIEMPLKGRERWHSKAALEKAGKLATSVLKGDYEIAQRRASGEIIHKSAVDKIHSRWYDKGLRRWHFFGDAPVGIAAVLDSQQGAVQQMLSDEFSTAKYNPHLNVLVPGGVLSDMKLEYIKAMLRSAFNEPELIVNYSFTNEPGRIVHLVKYATRATFLDIRWDKYLAGSLYGFRNMRSWGRWDVETPVWTLADLINSDAAPEVAGLNVEAINALGECRCYLDGLPIYWTRPQPIALLHFIQEKQRDKVESLGAGYYRLPDITMPFKESFESDTMRLTSLVNKIQADWRAEQRCKISTRHELSLDKTQPWINEGLSVDYSKPISEKGVQTDIFSAGTSKTNLSQGCGNIVSKGLDENGA